MFLDLSYAKNSFQRLPHHTSTHAIYITTASGHGGSLSCYPFVLEQHRNNDMDVDDGEDDDEITNNRLEEEQVTLDGLE
jgi:type IV secretory pathway VirB9-like protein